MRKVVVLSALSSIACQALLAQNLVQNPSFETYTSCPAAMTGELWKATPWTNHLNSNDYFNICGAASNDIPFNNLGTQAARTGNAYAGFIPVSGTVREYMRVPLSSPLINGTTYAISFYVNLGDNVTKAASAIGAYLSVGMAPAFSNGINPPPVTPQIMNPLNNFITDKINWTLISGIFTASGGENYITIGHFATNADTLTVPGPGSWTASYYYVEDVSVIPAPLNATQSQTNPACNGQCTGTSIVIATGGSAPYTYSWNTIPVQTTQTASGLCAGNYTVVVTDAGSATTTVTVTITQPPVFLTGISSQTNISCNGGNNGAATATASGGTPGYFFNWSPSGGTNANATGLSANTYTVTITDANGCSQTQTVTLTQPAAFNITSLQNNVSCNGGNNGDASVNVSGGNTPYTYSWSPSGGTNANATGLTANTYTILITDASGCTATATITVTEPPALTSSIANTPVLCNGGNDGTATVTANGGTGPYSYNWLPSGGTNVNATGLTAGAYTVTVTDGNGCTSTSTSTIIEPSALTLTATGTNPLCSGNTGSATSTPGGGTSPYTYLWSNAQTTQNISGLSSGTYTILITDNNGCTLTQSVTITVPSAIVLTTSSTPAACMGNTGTATANASGGTAPLNYAWSPSSQTTQTATGLNSGSYVVTITDANGCTQTQSIIIGILPGPTALASGGTTILQGQSTPLTANGGTTYIWSPSTGLNCSSCQNPIASPSATTTYCVLVTDGNGCTDSACVTVIVDTQCGELFIPNAFSPNNDGQNEMECVMGNCITKLQFSVYDRWGEKVFETSDPTFCWDGTYKGKTLNTAVFVYILNAVLNNGEVITKKGNISLIR